MTPEQYAQVKAAFAAAIALPVQERREYVRKHFGNDDAVVAEVESLLAHHLDATQRIDQTTRLPAASADGTYKDTVHLSEPTRPASAASAPTVTRRLRHLGPVGLLPLGGLVVCGLLITVVLFAHASIHSIVHERRTEDIQSVLSFVEQSIHRWVDREKSEVERLLATSEFRQIVIELADRKETAQEVTPEELAGLRAAFDRELFHYLGSDGGFAIWDRKLNKRLDTRGDDVISSTQASEYGEALLRQALTGETLVLFPGNRRRLSGGEPDTMKTPWVRVLSPLRGRDGEVLAVILLRSPRVARGFSESLDSLRIGDTGEAIAFDQTGLLLTESRFTDRFQANGLLPQQARSESALQLYLRTPPVDLTRNQIDPAQAPQWPLSLLAEKAFGSDQGLLLEGYRNYLGYPTYGAWRQLPQYDFAIAYEVSRAEADRPYWFLKLESIVILCITLACAGGLLVALFSVQRLQRKIRRLEVVGSYTLLDKIGEGGMGQVFRARHALLKRPTAVKLLKPEIRTPRTVDLFEREVQIASQLMHPNTIQIYDYGESEVGQWYYAMEFVEGRNLQELIQSDFPFSTDRMIALLQQIAGALAEAHEKGVIHRDIKPQNIMVGCRAGVEDFVKVLDFGLATMLSALRSQQISIAGTIRYMAPECFLTPQDIGPASDVYSLGAIAYELLTGQPVDVMPLEQTLDLTAWANRLERLVGCMPEYSDPQRQQLRLLIIACLATNPQVRPANGSEFRRHLQEIVG